MPQKILNVDGIGTTKLYKRRGTRSLRITLAADHVRVTMPVWMPYASGLAFVQSKKSWIRTHQKEQVLLEEGMRVGKSHRLRFATRDNAMKPSVRTTVTEITVTHAPGLELSDNSVQAAAKRGVYKALKQEADSLLPMRLQQLAHIHGFEYNSVICKRMRSRWGSCNHEKEIALNVFLMQLPWELIDYVLLHELIHTKYLNHSPNFWLEFDRCMPSAKQKRSALKAYQPSI